MGPFPLSLAEVRQTKYLLAWCWSNPPESAAACSTTFARPWIPLQRRPEQGADVASRSSRPLAFCRVVKWRTAASPMAAVRSEQSASNWQTPR